MEFDNSGERSAEEKEGLMQKLAELSNQDLLKVLLGAPGVPRRIKDTILTYGFKDLSL